MVDLVTVKCLRQYSKRYEGLRKHLCYELVDLSEVCRLL